MIDRNTLIRVLQQFVEQDDQIDSVYTNGPSDFTIRLTRGDQEYRLSYNMAEVTK